MNILEQQPFYTSETRIIHGGYDTRRPRPGGWGGGGWGGGPRPGWGGYGAIGFGAPFLGGLLGGALGSSLAGPSYYYPQPFGYPYYASAYPYYY
nr:spore coat protein [Alteribacter salitolerans]